MSNVIHLLQEIQRLLELKGENPFKIRAFEKAARTLAGREDLLERARQGTLGELPGVGKGIQEILREFLLEGSTAVLDELQQSIPTGVSELTQISGLGYKKALILIEQLGIHTVGELEYACKENRLLKLKGFGPKIQEKILEDILFQNAHQGSQKLSESLKISEEFLKALDQIFPNKRCHETGALRRKREIMEELEFLVEVEKSEDQSTALSFLDAFRAQNAVMPIRLHFARSQEWVYHWAKTTGTSEHWSALGSPDFFPSTTEENFYDQLGLPWIPPETRETGEEVGLARSGYLSHLLPWDGLKGIFHNHTTWSDGRASLKEMVVEAQNQGFQYIGISDHSQSAHYASGLKLDALLEQEKEIRTLQEKHPGIRIFWGIESDILADGALDYEDSVLKRFDFVIASVHSRFKMDRETMTKRILAAIRNPYTRFLGHPTGRLLLGRKGYDVDMDAIIAEAAQHEVAVEFNSNPARLDLDWRWGPEMRKYQAFTSVNPDAHDTEGLKDTVFGIAMTRKALIQKDRVVNSKSIVEVEKWLKRN